MKSCLFKNKNLILKGFHDFAARPRRSEASHKNHAGLNQKSWFACKPSQNDYVSCVQTPSHQMSMSASSSHPMKASCSQDLVEWECRMSNACRWMCNQCMNQRTSMWFDSLRFCQSTARWFLRELGFAGSNHSFDTVIAHPKCIPHFGMQFQLANSVELNSLNCFDHTIQVGI